MHHGRSFVGRLADLAGTKGWMLVRRRMLAAAVIMWIPAALLSLTGGAAATDSFLSDFAQHARSLITAPLLILSEITCLPLLREFAAHFKRLSPDEERAACDRHIASMLSFRTPPAAMIAIAAIAYAATFVLLRSMSFAMLPSWQTRVGVRTLSAAGWWHWLVSVPLVLGLLFGWFWRVFLWGRFLCRMARMKLRLVASHPDGVAGLKFIGYSPLAFIVPAFALGSMVAGMVANRVLHFGESAVVYRNNMIGVAVFAVVVFCGPLIMFSGRLLAARRQALLAYSGLARDMGVQFERKWLDRGVDERVGSNALEAPDFSAVFDLYGIAGNVYRLNPIPLDARSLFCLVVAALLPFLPVALLSVPFVQIIQKAARLLA